MSGLRGAYNVESIKNILKHYPSRRSALLPALGRAQQIHGWLSPEAMESVADLLNLTLSEVRAVATFHDLFRKQPQGRHLIQLCTNVSCMLFGAESLIKILENEFSVKPGTTSADGRFTLKIMECIGACDAAPAMVVDGEFHTVLDKDSLVRILKGYE